MRTRHRVAAGHVVGIALLLVLAPIAAGQDRDDVITPGPENGRFVDGLAGWESLGRVPVELSLRGRAPSARLEKNTTLVSPPTLVPRTAQAVEVLARAPRGRALIVVRARTEDGERVRLGVIAPGGRLQEQLVGPLDRVAGEVVRLELDPVTSLGRTVEIGGIGSYRAPLRGWRVLRGVPVPAATGARFLIRDAALRATRRVSLPPGPARVSVRVRGEGRLDLRLGGARTRVEARPGWRTVSLAAPARARRALVQIVARPGLGRLEIAEPGRVVRPDEER